MLGWRSSQSHLAVDEAAVRPTGVQISHPAPKSLLIAQKLLAKLPTWLSGRASHW